MSDIIKDNNFDLVLIQLQDIVPLMEHAEQLKVIMNTGKRDSCIDAYLLGYMHGKRAERARKKAR